MKIFEKTMCDMGLHDFFTDGCDEVWKALDHYDLEKNFDVKLSIELVRKEDQ